MISFCSLKWSNSWRESCLRVSKMLEPSSRRYCGHSWWTWSGHMVWKDDQMHTCWWGYFEKLDKKSTHASQILAPSNFGGHQFSSSDVKCWYEQIMIDMNSNNETWRQQKINKVHEVLIALNVECDSDSKYVYVFRMLSSLMVDWWWTVKIYPTK